MKYRNKQTGIILEPRSAEVEKRLAADDRFEEYAEKPAAEKPVDKMNKEELLAKAAEMGIQVPEGAKNDDIKNLIKAASAQ